MAVSRVRGVERSPVGWLSYPLPAALVAWLSNDVPACRGSRRGVAHKRGASAERDPWNWACPPRSLPQVKDREEGVRNGGGDDRDRPAQGLAYRGGDRPGGSAAGPVAGTGLRCPGGAVAGVGAGLAAAHLGGRRRGRGGPSAGPATGRRG